MNNDFQAYNTVSAGAFDDLLRPDELTAKKTQNFLQLLENQGIKTILHMGYGPTAVGLAQAGYEITCIDANTKTTHSVDLNGTFDAVIALDEYFTFAKTEEQQRDLINTAFNLTKKILITTLSDYKNMTENHREFSDPQSYKTVNGSTIYLERHAKNSRNSWNTKVHKILESDECITFGPFARRSLFFKQLARMSADAGSTSFEFQKSMMYKGMLQKNYQHIIVIKF